MKKKFLTAVLFMGLVVGLTGCNKFSEEVLKDENSAGWVIHGQVKLADGTENGWNGKDSALYVKSKMTATSVKDVSTIDKGVAKALSKKNVKYLYKYEGVHLGENDAGWRARYHIGDDFYNVNGSYVFKVAKCSYDAEDDVWAEDQWIHDPKTAHTEALTSNIFMPTWQQTLDEWGFAWNSNLVVTGGAGTYTIVVAQYDVVQSATVPGYGLAAIKTAEGTAVDEAVKEETFSPAAHTYGVIGSFEGSGWGSDVALAGTGPYTATVTLAENDEFKIRADGEWTLSWGWSNVDYDTMPADAFEDAGGNIKCLVAGSYTVTVSFSRLGVAKIALALAA